ncbi:MAG: metallophosphoesterase [Verrucomicrobia bacterium]|nr:metallophosphoesterase [Verrucomicrobiota bacterium]
MSLLSKILGVFCAIDLFVWWRSARLLGRGAHPGARWVVHGFFTAQVATLGAMIWGSFHQVSSFLLSAPFLGLAFLWHLLVAPLALVGNLLGVGIEAVMGCFRFVPRKTATAPADPNGISRRNFLGTVAALAPPVLTLGLGTIAARQLGHFRIRRLTVHLPGLPAALDGMTIAHLTDSHVGPFTNGRALKQIVEEANKLNADLMLFTGDLINHDLAYLPESLEMLRALRPEPVLCEGNHDLMQGRYPFESQVKAAGFRLLVDETVTVSVRGQPVQLLGLRWTGPGNLEDRHDETGIAASMHALLRQRDPAAFPILLAHHPHAWDYCGDLPLTLSGHTHGGQLMLNPQYGFGPLMFRYWSGLYSRPATSSHPVQTLVVNNGIGNWFPLRTAAPAEIIHLTLRRA